MSVTTRAFRIGDLMGCLKVRGESFDTQLFLDAEGNKIKRRHTGDELPNHVVLTGHYAFGANELHIMRALDRVLTYLEEHHSLKT
jgi:hypothetical protein